MKVLITGRAGLFDTMGGDRVQIENTAQELRKLGVEVDIQTGTNINCASYDLVHIFQLDWNPACFFQAKEASRLGIPVVFSPIHHNIEEVMRFENEFAFDFRRISKFLFKNQFHRDLFKEFYRALSDHRRLYPVLYAMLKGLDNMYRDTIKMSKVLLVQTVAEAEDLKKTFKVDFAWRKVSNGVSDQFIKISDIKNPLDIENYFICVGRIEPRKNQLNLIKAVAELREETKIDYRLVLVGHKSKVKHFEYTKAVDEGIKKYHWLKYVSHVPNHLIAAYYKYAKVGVSVSWFETSGLTSMEALFCGANAVATGERAHEFLGELATYCDPGSIKSIKDALATEFNKPRPVLSEELRKEYTWSHVAEKTLEVYNSIYNK